MADASTGNHMTIHCADRRTGGIESKSLCGSGLIVLASDYEGSPSRGGVSGCSRALPSHLTRYNPTDAASGRAAVPGTSAELSASDRSRGD